MTGSQSTSFVGRSREVDELLGAFAAAQAGSGSALQISGESGIGKTALAQRAATLARGSGMRVIWTSSLEDLAPPGYWTWREVSRQINQTSGARQQSWPEVSMDGDVSVSHLELFANVREVLGATAVATPLLLVFDDAQWMDSASARLRRYIAKHVSEMKLVLLATWRTSPDDIGMAESGWHGIELRGLSEDDVHELLQEAGAAADSTVVEDVLRRSGGNALFVRELSRLQAAAGSHVVPERLRDVVLRRLAQVEHAMREALGAASVLGFQFDTEGVASLLSKPVDEAGDTLRRLELSGIIVSAGGSRERWQFAHDLSREVIYADLADVRRRELHLLAGQWLESTKRGAEVEMARHFRLSGVESLRASIIALERRAGEAAFATAAFSEAGELFSSAAATARATGREDVFAELTVRAGEARRAAGSSELARNDFLAALPLMEGEPDLAARCVLGLAPNRMDLGFAFRAPDPEIVGRLRAALELRGSREDDLTVRLMSRLAAELYFSGERGEALALSERAVSVARAGESKRALADALTTHHDIALVGTPNARGSLEVANELVDAAIRLGEDESLLAARLARILDLLALGQRSEVEAEVAAFDRDAALAHRAGLAWFPAMWRAMLAIASGEFVEGEGLRLAALQLGLPTLGELAVWNAAFQQFFLAREQDGLKEVTGLTRAFALSNPEQPALACGLTYLLAETGAGDEARIELDRLAMDDFGGIRDRNWPVSWYLLSEAAVLAEMPDHAATLYRQGLPFAELAVFSSIGATWVGSFRFQLGNLAAFLNRPEAGEHLAGAVEFAKRVGFQPWVLEANVALAVWARSSVRSIEGLPSLEELERQAAEAGLARIARRAHRASETRPESAGTTCRAAMRRDGRVWHMSWQGRTTTIAEAKGVMDIAVLISRKGSSMTAIELMTRDAARPKDVSPAAANAGLERIDREALRQYRDRLRELDEEIREAERFSDLERLNLLGQEREYLLAEVRGSLDIGGRPRSERGDLERARKAVEMRVSFAVDRIAALDAGLAQHLKRSIRTGSSCIYEPETDVDWELSW